MKRLTPLLWVLVLVFCFARLTPAKVFAGPVQDADKTAAAAPASKIDLDRLEQSIRDFEAQDRLHPPAQGATVFVGSSTFTRWTSLEHDLKEYGAINRGFGGSTIPEVNHYIERIVLKYKPSRIVFYAGTNDIGQFGHSGRMVFDNFQKFVDTVHSRLPKTEIYFVSLSVAPSRLQNASEFRDGNKLVQAYCQKTARLHFIDVTPVMRDSDGRLKVELFGPDRLHMTPQGYALWLPVIRKALDGQPNS